MTANRLSTRPIEKVWGRHDLPQAFGALWAGAEPVGEISFGDPACAVAPLLVKYLLTSEKLSIQVHPDDEAARALGHRRGKDEAWVIVAAEPGARIGLGLTRSVTREELRAAALDGSIERLVRWREAKAGDVYHSPAGTIHALGPGLTLIEVQQNCDLTYRLYDYGRPRELHLDAAVAAACLEPWEPPPPPHELSAGREILVDCPAFVLERWTVPAGGRLAGEAGRPVWVIPVRGGGLIDGQPLAAPGVWLVEDHSRVRLDPDSEMLFAYPGGGVIAELFIDTRVTDAGAGAADRRLPARRIDPVFVAPAV